MQLRQVQADEAPRRRLRQVRRRGHPVQGAPRAHGAHRAGEPGLARLVLQEPALAHRHDPQHHAARPGAGALFRVVHRDRTRADRPQGEGAGHRREVPAAARGVRCGVQGRHGRRGDQEAAQDDRRRVPRRRSAGEDARGHLRGGAQEDHQAAQGRRGLPQVRLQAGVDDLRRDRRDPAGAAPARAARRRPLRDLGPQRPLPPGDQSQQPSQAPARAQGPGHHHPQRETDAPGGGRRALRQRPARSRDPRAEQAPAQVALRHAQGQAGAFPPEPARQARRLLGTLGHRGRPGTQDQPVRSAEEDGPRTVQALHLPQARTEGAGHHAQERQEDGREGAARGLGRPRRGHEESPGHAQPRPDPAPAGHSGVLPAAHRGQGDPAPPARLFGVQRRLRRRPDGRSHPALRGGAEGSPRADAQLEQHPFAGQRQAARGALPGHRARLLLPDQADRQQRPRAAAVRRPARGAPGLRPRGGRPAREDPRAHRSADGRDDAGPGDPLGDPAAGALRIAGRGPGVRIRGVAGVRAREQADEEEGAGGADRRLLPPPRSRADHRSARRAQGHRLPLRHRRRRLDRDRRHADPGQQEGCRGRRPQDRRRCRRSVRRGV